MTTNVKLFGWVEQRKIGLNKEEDQKAEIHKAIGGRKDVKV